MSQGLKMLVKIETGRLLVQIISDKVIMQPNGTKALNRNRHNAETELTAV